MEIESATHRRILALVTSLMFHTIVFSSLTVSSRPPTKTSATNRRGEIAQPHGPAHTEVVPPARGGESPAPPQASKPLVTINSTALLIPGFTFDVGKIAARALVLFPFLDLQLSIPPGPAAPFRPVGTPTHHGLIFVRPVVAQPTERLPPLRLSDTAFQTVVDTAWSRRARWNAFKSIRRITDHYSGETGGLPNLLRAYVEQDALQPFYDTTIPDPRLWSELDIAADHFDFIQFIVGYAARHPSTRATTELLFLLDKLTQANFDALATLLDTEPNRDLRWTVAVNKDASQLIRALRSFYIERLGEQASNRTALKARYDAVRLQILQSIVRTSPDQYRANDARFLIGAIEWRAGDRQAAVRTWQGLEIHQTDYFAASSSYVAGILNEGRVVATVSAETATRIDKMLDNEDARWITFSSARLRRFGYELDTF